MVERYEYRGFTVEIHVGVNGYFWVTGESPKRFSGPCEYFPTIDEAKTNAECLVDEAVVQRRGYGVTC